MFFIIALFQLKTTIDVKNSQRSYSIPFSYYFQVGGNYSINIKNGGSDVYLILLSTKEDIKEYNQDQQLFSLTNSSFSKNQFHILYMQNGEGNITGIIEKEGRYQTEIRTCAYFNNGYIIELTYMNPNSCLSSEILKNKKYILMITIASLFLLIQWILNWIKYFSYHNSVQLLLTFSFFFYAISNYLLLLELDLSIKSNEITNIHLYRKYFQSLYEFFFLYSLKLFCSGYGIFYTKYNIYSIFESFIISISYPYIDFKIEFKFGHSFIDFIWITYMILAIFGSFIINFVFLVVYEDIIKHDRYFFSPFARSISFISFFYNILFTTRKIIESYYIYSQYNFYLILFNYIIVALISYLFKMEKNTLNNYYYKNRYICIFRINKFTNNFNNRFIEYAIIPSRIRTIGESAFMDSLKLKKIKFEKNSKLEKIDKCAFFKSAIKRIEIPSELKYIGVSAFAESSIERIKIPSKVINIDKKAFSHCRHLKKIEFENNSKLNSINYSTFEYSSIESFSFPSTISVIDEDAFYKCKYLSKIEFPDNSELSIIGRNAFYSCINLKKIHLNVDSKLYIIKKSAFEKAGITSFIVPCNVTQIEKYAFYKCLNLQLFLFLENSKVTSISKFIFGDLENVHIFVPVNLRNYVKL